MKNRLFILGALILILESCSLYGKFEKSAYQPEHFNDTLPTWQNLFTDAPLQALIQRALDNNYDLRIAHEHVKQAEATLLGTKLAYLPVIGAGGNPAVQYTSAGSGYNLSYSFAQASWEIDIFGRLTNQKRMANAALLQSRDYEQAARCELIASVVSTYYLLATLDAQIETCDSAVAICLRSVETMRAMKEAGMTDEAAVSQFNASYHSMCIKAKQLRLERTQAENTMRELIAEPQASIERNNMKTLMNNMVMMENINLRATRQRPDVMAAEHNLERMFYNRNYARSSCCPSIGIGGSIGWNATLIFSAVGSLLQPIFNAGRNITQLKVSKSQLEEAQLNYTNTLMKAATQVNNTLVAQQTAIAQLPDYDLAVQSLERAFDATQTKMRLGQGTYIEVLISQNDLLEAQINHITARANILVSNVNLFKVLGGK